MREIIKVDGSLCVITCYKCGIFFGVPDYYDAQRRTDLRKFWCPNGHGQAYVEQEKISGKPLKERQEIILAIHQAEQAEARAAEGKASPSESSESAGHVIEGSGFRCGLCGKRYRALSGMWIQRHLMRQHGMGPKEALDSIDGAKR